jgi:hypothetical protein
MRIEPASGPVEVGAGSSGLAEPVTGHGQKEKVAGVGVELRARTGIAILTLRLGFSSLREIARSGSLDPTHGVRLDTLRESREETQLDHCTSPSD